MKMIWEYAKVHLGRIWYGIILRSLSTVGELMIPYAFEYVIDYVVPGKQIRPVFLWGGLMIALSITVRFLRVKANRISAEVSRDCIKQIRYDLFQKTINLSGNRFDAFGLPSLTSRMTSDSYNVQSFITRIQNMGIRVPITLIGGIIVTMTMDIHLALILVILLPIVTAVVFYATMHGIPLFRQVQMRLDDVVRVMRENISGIRVIKALSKEPYEVKRFQKVNYRMAEDDLKAGTFMAIPGPFMSTCLNIGLTMVVLVGANRVNAGQMKPGVILAFLTYFNLILQSVMGLNRVFMMTTKTSASADRIAQVLNDPLDQRILPITETADTDENNHIVFDHVSFGYGINTLNQASASTGVHIREKTLDDISFTIKRGESLGIIGSTGCGKTTIINLLMRMYDANEGTISVNGKDVRTYEKDELRKMFGVVFQNDIIFADTLQQNIDFGRNISPDRMKEAAEDACVADFIQSHPEGFAYTAAIKGGNLSGGQKQRVLIARALAAKPEILILDDSSSALDYRTDAALRKAIQEHYDGTTTIMVAQRISSIMNMTHILMLQDGKIWSYGTHEELLRLCPEYREIFDSQMGALVS